MNPIAIFYYVMLGADKTINPTKADLIMTEQIDALKSSGLLGAASEFHVNSQGGEFELCVASALAGPGATVTCATNSLDGADGELPTFGIMQDWLPNHSAWNVFYFHAKGVTKPDDAFRMVWRRCMMRATVHRWRECVGALESGFDMAGAHWLSPQQYPNVRHLVRPIWGGNFWWAKASYLLTLPPLIRQAQPEKGMDRYWAENWVGLGNNPKVSDLAPHWPAFEQCSRS